MLKSTEPNTVTIRFLTRVSNFYAIPTKPNQCAAKHSTLPDHPKTGTVFTYDRLKSV